MPQTVEFKRELAATPEAAEIVLEEILQALADSGVVCGDADEIRMALREALNNAVRHGSGLDASKKVYVGCRCDPQEGLWIRIRDEGKGFDPDKVPDPTHPENIERPGGRGVYMIRQLMDEVEYRDAGRELLMRRRPRPVG
jgi:serine/threonine-protein kinase RsbW